MYLTHFSMGSSLIFPIMCVFSINRSMDSQKSIGPSFLNLLPTLPHLASLVPKPTCFSTLKSLLPPIPFSSLMSTTFSSLGMTIHLLKLSCLQTVFTIRDLGPAHYFLSIELKSHIDDVLLSQSQYINSLLCRVNIATYKPTTNLCWLGTSSVRHEGGCDPTLYHRTIRALKYLALTRLDIAFVVNHACQFMHQPTLQHWLNVKHLLCYLRGTSSFGLLFHLKSNFHLSTFSDVDYASCSLDCRSSRGYLIFLGSNLIFWASKK